MIVDDHCLVRDGITLLLDDLPNFQVIAKASNREEAIKLTKEKILTKGSSLEKTVQAIHTVVAGKTYLDPEIAQQLAQKDMSGSLSLFDSLSIRELTVMIMIANGIDAHTIAEKLYVSTKTVNTYCHHLYKKLNLKNDVELTLFSIEKGLLDKKIL